MNEVSLNWMEFHYQDNRAWLRVAGYQWPIAEFKEEHDIEPVMSRWRPQEAIIRSTTRTITHVSSPHELNIAFERMAPSSMLVYFSRLDGPVTCYTARELACCIQVVWG